MRNRGEAVEGNFSSGLGDNRRRSTRCITTEVVTNLVNRTKRKARKALSKNHTPTIGVTTSCLVSRLHLQPTLKRPIAISAAVDLDEVTRVCIALEVSCKFAGDHFVEQPTRWFASRIVPRFIRFESGL